MTFSFHFEAQGRPHYAECQADTLLGAAKECRDHSGWCHAHTFTVVADSQKPPETIPRGLSNARFLDVGS